MSRSTDIPPWINPCGHTEPPQQDNTVGAASELSEKDLISHIQIVTAGALSHANHFVEKFAAEKWNMNSTSLHEQTKGNTIKWIEPLPKSFREKVSVEHLQTIQLRALLPKLYTHLQKIAAGLEQMSTDEESGPTFSLSKTSEDWILQVLCEIQTAIYEMGMETGPDVTRADMPTQERNCGISERSARDWLLLREYVNSLEYLEQVLEYEYDKN